MEVEHLVSNLTFTENDADIFDPYCSKSLFGLLIWSCYTALSAGVGLPASVWLLWVFAQRQISGLAIDIYTFNLTIMDLIFNFSIPLAIINTLSWKHDFFSKVWPIVLSLNMAGRPLLALYLF